MSTNMSPLAAILSEHRASRPVGITSVCSAHPVVLRAALNLGRVTGRPVLIESTCNQVNQEGGYTGLRPADFARQLVESADAAGLSREQLILGGDHLGPNPWRARPAAEAMAKACRLVADCVRAGYHKIHLDASMRLGDDPPGPLDTKTIAGRSAELAAAAEAARAGGRHPAPVYVIGTEVPVPGGTEAHEGAPAVTNATAVAETLAETQAAFRRRHLDGAWERVVAVVVQPGVEYGDDSLFAYERDAVAALSQFITTQPRLVYEAHSTDYQTEEALRRMVEDHFAILKVGPALTFAYREALFALEMIERELLGSRRDVALSDLRQVLDRVMQDDPAHWRGYYSGDEAALAFKRAYSLSDRIRYYWPRPEVAAAVARLTENLSHAPIPPALLSQYLPRQYEGVRAGQLADTPTALAETAVRFVLEAYERATTAQQL